ncbi:uric acid degradation bifunctional protein TTL-like [Arachis hypogaea]|uniref:uric acid degradation bifunctional protein TTL-like n=1 Tax=Arachis hypogaea TaxID=3818 RepID=UPI003B16C9B6
MVQASPFSSLEYVTSFARDLWFNKLPINSWLDAFFVHMHIGEAVNKVLGSILKELSRFGPKYCKKFGFWFITSTNNRLSHQILEEVKTCYENSLVIELDITFREEFLLIERGLARL